MVEMNGNMMVKSEPMLEEAELFNSLVANGNDHQQQQHQQQQQQQQELRFLCMYKLKIAEDTVDLLEAQQIDVECLRKMRIEDIDALFEGKPLGPKILFREAFLEWREEIGQPCKSIKAVSCRKRAVEPYESLAVNSAILTPSWEDIIPPQPVLNEKDVLPTRETSTVSYRSFQWPMTPCTLKDVLNSSAIGRSIMAMGCLGGLGKSLQYQLTAIVIDYHMAYEAKITTPQLENYAFCITTLLPHENGLSYHTPRGPNRRNPGGSLYSRFINQKISKKALAIGNSVAAS